jgi:hypothetical protein
MSGVQCGATSKRTGEQCRRWCSVGFRTCRWHGSATAGAIRKAGERAAEIEARRHLADMGEAEPVDDPIGRLQTLAGEADQLLAFARQRFAATDDTSWLVIYARSLESTQKQLHDLAKLLPAYEQVKSVVTEQDVQRLLAALNAALACPEAALSSAQQAAVREAMAVHLTAGAEPQGAIGTGTVVDAEVIQ